jgi:benzoyl-CoA-dihydrodiol lyase
MSSESGVPSLCAVNGTASGGGYELAIACDEIVLADDGSTAVSFPEAPLLAVLPGTGGLTRLVDKRKIRRDLADAFSTIAEGVRGKRAVEWGLVDEAPAKAKFDEVVKRRTESLVAKSKRRPGKAIALAPLGDYEHVRVELSPKTRTATLTMKAPADKAPASVDDLVKLGSSAWCIQAWRELDDALLDLRFNQPDIGVVALKTSGDAENVISWDTFLAKQRDDGLVRECVLLMKRVMKRLDMTAKSFFALGEPGSCFVGSLLELALAADRFYMKDDPDAEITVATSPMNAGLLPMGNGPTRLQTRFLAEPSLVNRVLESGPLATPDAVKAGLVTFAPDDIDWDDEIRIAFEERAAMSPDAMTGMEANLRFPGPETLETKIFARLSAWQNWIFQRPNAVGEKGALTLYGKPERPEFNWSRT